MLVGVISLTPISYSDEFAPQVSVPATIHVPAELEVISSKIVLGEIAVCNGNRTVCDEMYGVDLGESPTPGSTKYLTKSTLDKVLKNEWPELKIILKAENQIKITSPAMEISSEMVREEFGRILAARAEVLPGYRVNLQRVQMSRKFRVRPGKYHLEFPVLGNKSDNAQNQARILKSLIGYQSIKVKYIPSLPTEAPREFTVSAHIGVEQRIPVPMFDIERGKTIHDQDLDWGWVTLKSTQTGYYESPKRIVGKSARTTLKAGKAISTRSLASPVVIKRGQIVTLILSRKGMNVKSQAKALESGSWGQRISVMNTFTKKRLTATIKDRTTVQFSF